jgi:hypothetical protein
MTELFARVHNDKVVEFPISRMQIVNSGEQVSYFYPVRFSRKPKTIPAYHFAKEVLEIMDDYVQVNYAITPIGLDQLLIRVYHPGGVLNDTFESVTAGNVEPALYTAFIESIKVEVQAKLDKFAQERGYDDMVSCITYRDSAVNQFRNDANRCITIRDNTWATLYAYLAEVQAGTKPVPKNRTYFMSLLPATTWA